jgi:hypothetical protein
MAKQYASAAGNRLGDNGRLLEHRVPKKRQQNVPFQSTGNRQRTSPQTQLVQGRLRKGETTRIDYGRGSHVTPLTKEQANKTLVPANGKLRVSKAQAAKIKESKPTAAPKKPVELRNVQRGPKNFTPGRRAEAALRANQRSSNTQRLAVRDGEGRLSKGTITRSNPATGTQVKASWKNRTTGHGRDVQLEVNSPNARSGSKARQKLKAATLEDQVGRQLRELRHNDVIGGKYKNQAQARLGGRLTSGVVAGDANGNINTVRNKTGVFKNTNGQYNTVPDMGGRLRRLSQSQTTRTGRRLGGNSNTTMRRNGVQRLKNGQPVTYPQKAPNGSASVVKGRRLGGKDKRIAFQRLYHGTTPDARRSIEANGFRAGTSNVYGRGVYTSTNPNIARAYSESKTNQGLVRLQVPKGSVTRSTPVFSKKKGATNLSQVSLEARKAVEGKGGKVVRVDNASARNERRNVLGTPKGNTDYTVVNKDYANKHILKGKNNRLHLTKEQRQKLAAKSSRRSYGNIARSESNYFTTNPHNRRYRLNNITQNIDKAIKSNSGGFTVDPSTGKNPGRGYQVAIDGAVLRDTSPAGIKKFVEKNRGLLTRADVKVGGWKDPKTGKTTIELSRRVRSRAEAERLGKKFDQKAIYDNKSGQTINTGGSDLLRHTKGNQTAGGARIGGQRQVARLKANRSGTVKRPVSAPKGKTQATPTRTVKLGPGIRGPKNFTPARRAQALQRANDRNFRETQGRFDAARAEIKNHGAGVYGHRYRSRSEGSLSNSIAFGNSPMRGAAKQGRLQTDTYGSRRDLNLNPQSKLRDKIGKAALKDMMGKLLDVPVGEKITAEPTTNSRGSLYYRASKKALGQPHGHYVDSARTGTDTWDNLITGKKVKFDPKSLREALQKIASSKATRVGRRAGGTSKTQARISPAKGQVRPTRSPRKRGS